MSENTKTRVGGWIKAVFMQEGNLPTVADCCRLAALVEHALKFKQEIVQCPNCRIQFDPELVKAPPAASDAVLGEKANG